MQSLKEFLAVILIIGYLIVMVASFVRWQSFQRSIRRQLGTMAFVGIVFTLFLVFGGDQALGTAIQFALLLAIPGALFAGPFGALLLGTFGLVGGFFYGLTLIGQ
jgi:hypothetical protein